MAENYINSFSCQLTAGCTSSDGTISVSSSALASSGFRIRIGNELMLVTGGGTTTTWNVTRGIESSSAASHPSGTAIRVVLSKGSLDQVKADWLGGMLPSDDFYIKDPNVSGYAWPLVRRVKLPDFTGYSWVNQGTATIAAVKSIGAYRFQIPQRSGSDNQALYLRTAPATPYTFTVLMTHESIQHLTSNIQIGVAFRESSSGKITTLHIGSDTTDAYGTIFVSKMTNETTWSGNNYVYSTCKSYPVMCFQLADDGTNRYYRLSVDGYHFQEIFSVARTDYHTPNQVGIFMNNSTYPTLGSTIFGVEVA